MILADCHVHSCFSSDADTPVEQIIEAAIAQGRKYFYLTDHHDFDYPIGEDGRDFQLPREDYTLRLEQLRDAYKDKIELRIGVEMGLMAHIADKINDYVSGYPFDFVIGSIHTINLIDIAHNEYYEHKTKDEVHELYFKTMLECVKHCDYFDVLGHLDYVRRYGPFVDKSIDYAKYQELIDEIYKLLIAKGKGIEINLSGYRVFDESLPNYDQVKRYYDLGGRIITIGTDSHQKEYIGKHLDKALKMCEAIGFKDITTFTKREVD